MTDRIPGLGKDQILYIAEDFDAPMELVDSKELSELREAKEKMEAKDGCTGNVQVSDNVAYYQGGQIGQAWSGDPVQKPCPNCGHCPCCGRGGYNTQPLWPGYPKPYIGDWPWDGGTYTVTCGTSQHTIAGGIGAQSIQPNF